MSKSKTPSRASARSSTENATICRNRRSTWSAPSNRPAKKRRKLLPKIKGKINYGDQTRYSYPGKTGDERHGRYGDRADAERRSRNSAESRSADLGAQAGCSFLYQKRRGSETGRVRRIC